MEYRIGGLETKRSESAATDLYDCVGGLEIRTNAILFTAHHDTTA